MNNKVFDEADSLELILSMIEKTRRGKGRPNIFAAFGIAIVVVGGLAWALVALTNNPLWNFLWFLLFPFWAVLSIACRKNRSGAQTYMEEAIDNVWKVLGFLYIITPVFFAAAGFAVGNFNAMSLTAPLCLIYTGIGVAFVGIMVKDGLLVWIPVVFMLIPMLMIYMMYVGMLSFNWFMAMVLICFAVLLFLPWVLLNRKYAK